MGRSIRAQARAPIAAACALLIACSAAAQSVAPDIVVVKTMMANLEKRFQPK